MVDRTQTGDKKMEKEHREQNMTKTNKECVDREIDHNRDSFTLEDSECQIKCEKNTSNSEKKHTHNPNNYHWSEQDVSQESKILLEKIFHEKKYKIEKLNIRMYLVNRMNHFGFMYEMALELEKDDKKISLKDIDNYSDIKEKDIREAMEAVKEEIIRKYGKETRALQKEEQNTNPLKQFIKIGTTSNENQIETKTDDRNTAQSSDFEQRSLDQTTQDLLKMKEFVREGPKKTDSSFSFIFVGKLSSFYSYFLDFSHFRRYAPQSTTDMIQMGGATIYKMEKSQFILNLIDEEVLIKIKIKNDEKNEQSESRDWTIRFEYQCQRPDQIKSFLNGYLLPQWRMAFGALIKIK